MAFSQSYLERGLGLKKGFKMIKAFVCSLVFSFSMLYGALEFQFLEGTGEGIKVENGWKLKVDTPFAIIDCDEFLVEKDQVLEFDLPSSEAIVLVRDLSSRGAVLSGKVYSNGVFWLQSSQSIKIESLADIKASSLLFTTLTVSLEAFSSQEDISLSGQDAGFLSNKGSLVAENGDLIFVSKEILNEGVCKAEAGQVIFWGSSGCKLPFNLQSEVKMLAGAGRIVNLGKVNAAGIAFCAMGNKESSFALLQKGILFAKGNESSSGTINLFARKGGVEVTGFVQATDFDFKKGGNIHILGEEIFLRKGSEIDASGDWSGGRVHIGYDLSEDISSELRADLVFLEEGATVKADAREEGDGGTILFHAEKEQIFLGTASSKGGRTNGDGGLVEIRSNGLLQFRGKVNTTAPLGMEGICNVFPELQESNKKL